MRPLSNDLRERVVGAVNGGESCRSVAARFGVAASTVVKWSQRYRATGSVMPGKVGGHRKPVLDAHRAFIRQRIDQTSHLTLHKLKDELAARGVVVSHNAVWTFVRREGLSFKKTLFALEQARADVAHQRRHWHVLQAGLDPRRLVFIDETWIKTNMAPLRGWPAKGQRLRGFAPHGRWQTLTFLGALRRDRITAPCIFDGPINGQCRYSGPSAQDFGACRPIRPISTRSKRPSPRSNTGCASPRNAHPKPSRARASSA